MKIESVEAQKMGKRGVFGLENAIPFVIQILTIAVLLFACLFIISVFTGSTILPPGSTASNLSNAIFNNVTQGIAQFAANFPILFGILVVITVILMFSVVLLVLRRFAGSSGGGNVG